MNIKPIGVFDSGVGGLTVIKELHKILPGEDIVYFGDTGRLPYGTRSTDIIRKYTGQDIAFLLSKGVKHVTAACGTVSANIAPYQVDALGMPFQGIVEPAVRSAVAATRNGRIGVIATAAAIRSGAYIRLVTNLNPQISITENPAPLLVSLVENAQIDFGNQITRLALQMYLEPIVKAGVDTLILGCTHYPVIYNIVDDLLDHKVTLIDPGVETALTVRRNLEENGLLNRETREGRTTYYVSDSVESFQNIASIFLGGQLHGTVEWVDIDAWMEPPKT